MTTYHEWAEKKGRRSSTASAARRGATAFDVVEIDGMLVTEGVTLYSGARGGGKSVYRQGHEESSTNDRHGWHCSCVACRTDRGED